MPRLFPLELRDAFRGVEAAVDVLEAQKMPEKGELDALCDSCIFAGEGRSKEVDLFSPKFRRFVVGRFEADL